MWSFSKILCTKNYQYQLIFNWVIQKKVYHIFNQGVVYYWSISTPQSFTTSERVHRKLNDRSNHELSWLICVWSTNWLLMEGKSLTQSSTSQPHLYIFPIHCLLTKNTNIISGTTIFRAYSWLLSTRFTRYVHPCAPVPNCFNTWTINIRLQNKH